MDRIITASEVVMNIDPIHAGQVALASSLARSTQREAKFSQNATATGVMGKTLFRRFLARSVRWLEASTANGTDHRDR
jgi:hypothetical protein